jgi:hypothetical protein
MSFDAAHIHLMLNHLPVIGAPLLLLLLTIGLLRRSGELVGVSLVLAVGLAIVTAAVYLTGEPAEEKVEHASWFRESLAETHEEQAEASLVTVLATGVAATAALVFRRRPRAGTRLAALTWAGLLLSTAMLGWTAWSGGKIRHEEVRSGVTSIGIAHEAARRQSP